MLKRAVFFCLILVLSLPVLVFPSNSLESNRNTMVQVDKDSTQSSKNLKKNIGAERKSETKTSEETSSFSTYNFIYYMIVHFLNELKSYPHR